MHKYLPALFGLLAGFDFVSAARYYHNNDKFGAVLFALAGVAVFATGVLI